MHHAGHQELLDKGSEASEIYSEVFEEDDQQPGATHYSSDAESVRSGWQRSALHAETSAENPLLSSGETATSSQHFLTAYGIFYNNTARCSFKIRVSMKLHCVHYTVSTPQLMKN